MHKPRHGLPALPPLDRVVPNNEMAEFLGIAKSTLVAWKRRRPELAGTRMVRLMDLLDLDVSAGRAARLLGCATKTIYRRVRSGQLAMVDRGRQKRFALRTILAMRTELAQP